MLYKTETETNVAFQQFFDVPNTTAQNKLVI